VISVGYRKVITLHSRALACSDLHISIDFSNSDIEISEDEGSALLWGRVKITSFFEPVRLSAARQSVW